MTKLTLLLWIVTSAILLNLAECSVTLTTSMNEICPIVRLSCIAEEFSSTTLRWFINDIEFARYADVTAPIDQYPLTLQPLNMTFNSSVGGVTIQIFAARLSDFSQDLAHFNSSMTANISALQEAGVARISCGSFGTRDFHNLSFNSLTNVPPKPQIIRVKPRYNFNSNLDNILVMWNEVTSITEYCVQRVDYSVALEVEGHEIEQTEVSIVSCESGICSALFSFSASLPPAKQVYSISVTAFTIQGHSEPEIYNITIDGTLESVFNYNLTFRDCVTVASCHTSLSEKGNCSFQYGQDSSFKDLGSPINSSLNSTIQLFNIEVSILYYVQVNFSLNSMTAVRRGNFSIQDDNGDCRPEDGLIVALSISVCAILLVCVVVVSLIIVLLYFKRRTAKQSASSPSECETEVECRNCGSTSSIMDFKWHGPCIACEHCEKKMSNVKKGVVFWEEFERNAYIYKQVGLIFYFDFKKLCVYSVNNVVSSKDKFLEFKLDEIKTDVTISRPEVLNSLSFKPNQNPENIKCYTFSLKSTEEQSEWSNCLSKNYDIHDGTDNSSSSNEESGIVFAGTVDVAWPKADKQCNWTKTFIVWTQNDVEFYPSIELKNATKKVNLIEIMSVSGNNNEIKVFSSPQFNLRLLHQVERNMAEVFQAYVAKANPKREKVDYHKDTKKCQSSSSSCDIHYYTEIEKDWGKNMYYSTSQHGSRPALHTQHSSPALFCDARDYSKITNTNESTKENYSTTSFKMHTRMCHAFEFAQEDYSSLDTSRHTNSYNTIERSMPRETNGKCLDLSSYSHFTSSLQQYSYTSHTQNQRKLDRPN